MTNRIKEQKTKILEAINDLELFLESDLYSKFRPWQKLPSGKKGKLEDWYRRDYFKNEKDFQKYLSGHFNISRKAIRKTFNKSKASKEKQ